MLSIYSIVAIKNDGKIIRLFFLSMPGKVVGRKEQLFVEWRHRFWGVVMFLLA
jgi:hypothetical protein